MTTTRTDRPQRLADAWRKYADMMSGCGAQIAALGYLGTYANAATPDDERKAAEALTDVIAALNILSAERAARREGTR